MVDLWVVMYMCTITHTHASVRAHTHTHNREKQDTQITLFFMILFLGEDLFIEGVICGGDLGLGIVT